MGRFYEFIPSMAMITYNVHMVKGWKMNASDAQDAIGFDYSILANTGIPGVVISPDVAVEKPEAKVAELEARLEALEENVQLLNRWIETFTSVR